MTDPIADMLTRIKNGYLAKHREVILPYSRLKESLAKILVKHGYLKDLKVEANKEKTKKTIILGLKYKARKPVMEKAKRISKPGLRVYANTSQLKRMIPGLGIMIISTNQGLLTLGEAKKANQGGEIICQVW
jgi:small subunit ribosomal protein S8